MIVLKKVGEVIEKSQPESIIPQTSTEHTPSHQPIENNEGVINDAEVENTLMNMKKQKGFFNIEERDNGDIIWNGFSIEKIVGKKLEINEKIHIISDDLQNVFTNTSNFLPLKKLNDKDSEIYKKILESLDFENYKAIRGEIEFVRYKYSKINFK